MQSVTSKRGKKKRIKVDWGRQGGVIFAYLIILLGYYGIIANFVMVDELGRWISYLDMDKTILFSRMILW